MKEKFDGGMVEGDASIRTEPMADERGAVGVGIKQGGETEGGMESGKVDEGDGVR